MTPPAQSAARGRAAPAQPAARGRASTAAGRGEAEAPPARAAHGATRRRPIPRPRRAHTGATTRFRPATAPRRVSGPAATTGLRTRRRPAAPVGRRLLATLAALPDHALVDRAVRGRAWIAVVGTLLIGIVALQVSMLKLNAASSRAVERSSALERDNARLETLVAGMSAPERIRAKAEKLGLTTPQVEQVRYVPAAGGKGAAAAATAIRTGAFDPNALQNASASGPSSGDPSSDTGSTAAAVADGAGTMSIAEAQAALNDGDPSNDTQAMLNDGDPSNDAQAILNDGDPSNDGQATAGGDGTGSG